MSQAVINQLGFEPPKRVQNRIKAGSALVWLFALISMGVTLYYWYQLSGLEYRKDVQLVKFIILWLSVALGFALELAKIYFIFVGGYKKLWISAVIISVITVMGSYSILNQDRQNIMTKQSDTYKDARTAREGARKEVSQYAYIANTTLADLKAELQDNINKGGSNGARRRSGMSYQSFIANRADINKRISDRRKYDSANATLINENKAMQEQGLGGSSNPLFNSIGAIFANDAKQTAKIEGGILILFFFSTTVLAEIFAYFIGEKVRTEQEATFLTNAQVQDLKNKELFGIGVSEMMPEHFARLNDAQRDKSEAEEVIQQMRLTRQDASGNTLTPTQIAQETRTTRTQLELSSSNARKHSRSNSNTGASAISAIKQRYIDAKAVSKGNLMICPTCEKEFIKPHHRTIFCSSTGGDNCKDEYHNILNPERIGARRK